MKKKLFDPVKWYMKRNLGERKFLHQFVKYWGETEIDGIKVLNNRCYYFNGNYRTIPNSPACDVNSAPEKMPLNCHYERKLLKFLGTWENVRDADKKGIEKAWLFLNTSKVSDIQYSAIIDNVNAFADNVKNNNNEIELKILIPKKDSYINGEIYEVGTGLNLPGTTNKEYIEEEVFLLDGNGEIVQEELFTTNPDGSKESYSPKRYINKTVKQIVVSYTETKDYLINNFKDIWDNRLVISERIDRKYKNVEIESLLKNYEKDPFEEILARYSLFLLNNNNSVRITYIGEKVIEYLLPTENSLGIEINRNCLLPAYVIRFVIRFNSNLDAETSIGKQIKEDCEKDYVENYTDSAGTGYNYALSGFNYYGKVNGFKTKRSLSEFSLGNNTVSSIYTDWNSNTNSSWWINGHLKSDVLLSKRYIKKEKERIELIQALVDSDYEKEKGNIFLSVGLVLAAIAIAVFFPPLGAGLLAAGEGIAMVTAIAVAIGTFSLILSLEAFALDALGMYADAGWISKFNKTIQPLVIVASLFLAVKGLLLLLEQGLVTASTLSVEQLLQNATDFVKDKFINISLNDIVSILSKGFDMYSSNQLKSMQESVNAKQAEYEKIIQSKEQSKYSDIKKDMANIMVNPLSILGSDYVYDTPYEPIYSEYHSGCSCRTTVLALMNDGARTYVENIV